MCSSDLEDALTGEIDGETVVTLTGRNPSGVGIEETKAMLRRFAERGAKIVIDSRSFSLSDLVEMKPWLIKPNQEEISAYCGTPVENMEDALEKGKELASLGIENVMISMGEQGALLITKEQAFHAQAPCVQVVSTIGAGDSAIAGFLIATARGGDKEICLATAVAFGTAACQTQGTRPPEREAVQKLLPQVQVTKRM